MRTFLHALVVLCFLNALSCHSFSKQKLSILQGPTSDTVTQISIVRKKTNIYNYTINGNPLRTTQTFSFKNNPWVIDHLYMEKLSPKVTYRLQVQSKGKLVEERTFKTLNKKRDFNFAITSCSNEKYHDKQKILWKKVWERNPEALFMIGDNTYADTEAKKPGQATPSELWAAHIKARNSLYLYKMSTLIPSFMIWDDHDYGANNMGKNYPFKKESLKIYNSIFPQQPITSVYQRGPGASSAFLWNKQSFFFMDNRFFREQKAPPKQQTHWGKDQEQWLHKGLINNNTPAWLINGDKYFGKYHHFESYERDNPTSFTKLLKHLSQHTKPVVFVSGDSHFFELSQTQPNDLSYKTYEITSSGIHSKMFPLFGKKP